MGTPGFPLEVSLRASRFKILYDSDEVKLFTAKVAKKSRKVRKESHPVGLWLTAIPGGIPKGHAEFASELV